MCTGVCWFVRRHGSTHLPEIVRRTGRERQRFCPECNVELYAAGQTVGVLSHGDDGLTRHSLCTID